MLLQAPMPRILPDQFGRGFAAMKSPTMLAPMHGVGSAGVRDLIAAAGCPGMTCAPFLRITEQSPNIQWILGQLHRTVGIPLSVQLLGRHPQHLALATQVLVDAGVDVVDLNLGCPTRQAVKKGVGAGLLSEVGSISRIVAAMRAACGARLSVKIRAVDSAAGELVSVARAIQQEGADFLTIHPRTRQQGYWGVADWDLVKRVKASVDIPIVGNGDLWYASDALRLMRSTGADAVMIGRPILRNPFLFRQIEELRAGKTAFVPSASDVLQHIRSLAELAKVALKQRPNGPEGALKEQIQFLLRSVPEPLRASLRQRTMRAANVSEVLRAIEPLGEVEQLDLAPDGPLRLEESPLSPTRVDSSITG
jgi:tRNA-dihydrouridine synthase B